MDRTIRKYEPLTIQALPWQAVEDHYSELISKGWKVEPMISLIQFIRNDDFTKRLFPHLSLDILCITIYDPAESQRETLYIRFDQHSRKWHFKYMSKPFEPIEKERYYDEDLGITKFSQFIEWLKW